MKQVFERANLPTPPFFRKLRKLGLVLAALSAIISAAPIALPALLVTIAGYTAVAGSVVAAVSQLAVDNEAKTATEINGEMPDFLPDYLDKDYVKLAV